MVRVCCTFDIFGAVQSSLHPLSSIGCLGLVHVRVPSILCGWHDSVHFVCSFLGVSPDCAYVSKISSIALVPAAMFMCMSPSSVPGQYSCKYLRRLSFIAEIGVDVRVYLLACPTRLCGCSFFVVYSAHSIRMSLLCSRQQSSCILCSIICVFCIETGYSCFNWSK